MHRRVAVLQALVLDGCVLPSTACADTRDVVTMQVAGRKLDFAVETLHLLSTTAASSGKVLTELKLRGLRVEGPKEITENLEPGLRRRVRGMLRPPTYLLIQAVEPLAPKR